MPGQATLNWEDVLNAYLEGRGLRADAEDLLMRLHLGADEREQIERSLRLADEVTTSMRGVEPSPGLGERLTGALSACPAPGRVPTTWKLDGDDFQGDSGPGEEDLLDSALEGRVALEELYAAQTSGQFSESGREALAELEAIAQGVADVSLPMSGAAPAGLELRLRDRLRMHMDSEDGQIDERIANRLLSKKTRERGPRTVLPDVLAAGEEPDKAGE